MEDTASGRLAWRDRAVGRLLTETVRTGDVVLFVEISRMTRSTLQVLEMLEHCMTQEMSVHIAKQPMVLDGSMQSHITSTVLGLAAEIEREMISLQTTKAQLMRAQALPVRGCTVLEIATAHGGSLRTVFRYLAACLGSTPYQWPVHSGLLMGVSVRADG